jgi:hypothetical protein
VLRLAEAEQIELRDRAVREHRAAGCEMKAQVAVARLEARHRGDRCQQQQKRPVLRCVRTRWCVHVEARMLSRTPARVPLPTV